ncbi:helix-turn-helix domain-containing protein [Sulfitobacter sp. D35]|uniref:TetR/AcrR family transcriptional regulator n=1 Tax=Sulfitobacter sp. D35 TaxID=3083252 RepID=UPI0029700414|nr:helix-turn-helix domain-containing protein [Sulfitobacter sp. D35]MDW4500004.1 helix-turn-helix domain-containing protein [Sulfitobacter sp. D35]
MNAAYIPIMQRARPYDRNLALDAAMTLFWRKGYHATSLKDLEQALHMKPGSIYAAFQSKEALYLAALERYFGLTQASLESFIAKAASPLSALADFLRSFGRPDPGQAAYACMIVKSMLDTSEQDSMIARAAHDYLDRMNTEITGIFREAQRLGELSASADPDHLARRYMLNVTALRIEAQRVGLTDELAALADEMADEIEALRQTA